MNNRIPICYINDQLLESHAKEVADMLQDQYDISEDVLKQMTLDTQAGLV